MATETNLGSISLSDMKTTAKDALHTGEGAMEKIRSSISNSAYDTAEDARRSVVNAIEAAARKLHNFKSDGYFNADTYIDSLAKKLDHFSKMLADKDAIEIAEDVKATAKQYHTPLILGGLALGYMAIRAMSDRRD